GPAAPRQRGSRARARGRDPGRRAEGDPRQDGSSHRVTFLQWLAYVAVVGGFWGVWYLVGAWAGILWTRRGLAAGVAVALCAVLGLRFPWALDAMLMADALLIGAVWLDAALATRPGAPAIAVFRDAPPAFSVGRAGEVSYRWVNATARLARLHVREVRPGLLGGTQPPRPVSVPLHGEVRDAVSVHPVRRGGERAQGGFAVDSMGPLARGRRRAAIPLPWDAAVYPPLVTVRLRASVARGQRAPARGVAALPPARAGRLFESLREWGPG